MGDEKRTFVSEFTANVDGFVQKIKTAGDSSDALSAAFTKSMVSVKLLEEAAAAAFKVVAEVVSQVVVKTANYGDEMLAASQKTGIAVDQLAGLRFAAEQGNASFGDLTGGLRKLSQNLLEANEGSKEQVAAFQRLGIATKDVHGNTRPLQDVFLDVAKRTKELGENSQTTAAVMAVLGKNADTLIPSLLEGAEGFQKAGDKARFFGAVMTNEAAAAGDAFNDSIGELRLAGEGLAMTLGEFLLPTITKLVQAFAGVIASVTQWVRQNPEVIKSFVSLGETIITAGVEATSLALQGITDLISGIAKMADVVGLDGIAGKLKTAASFTQNLTIALGEAATAFVNGSGSIETATKTTEKFNFELGKVGPNADAVTKALKDQQKVLADIEFGRIIDEQNAVNLAYSELIRIWTLDAKAAEELTAAADKLRIALDTEAVMEGWSEFQRTQSEYIRIWMAEAAEVDKQNQEISEGAIALWKQQQSEAEKMSQSFSVALGNITSEFSKAFADVLLSGADFGDKMKSIAMNTAETMLSAFIAGLIDPLTKEIAKLATKMSSLANVAKGGGGFLSALSFIPGVGIIAGAFAAGYGITKALLNRGSDEPGQPDSQYFPNNPFGSGGYSRGFSSGPGSLPVYGPDSPSYLAARGPQVTNNFYIGHVVGSNGMDEFTKLVAEKIYGQSRFGGMQIVGAQ